MFMVITTFKWIWYERRENRVWHFHTASRPVSSWKRVSLKADLSKTSLIEAILHFHRSKPPGEQGVCPDYGLRFGHNIGKYRHIRPRSSGATSRRAIFSHVFSVFSEKHNLKEFFLGYPNLTLDDQEWEKFSAKFGAIRYLVICPPIELRRWEVQI